MNQPAREVKNIRSIIAASSVGTLIEWYDFYIFGSLATVIASQFFPRSNPTAALLSTLATFAAGFVVRPFGALVFGRLGDLIGRKYTFLLTLIIMGSSTFAIGLVPGYQQIGFAAPLIVLVLRLLQGLALGGEYGGAATYVAEHARASRRGFFTSWIQTTATLGLLLSLAVILVTRHNLDSDLSTSIAKFNQWGWRIPFLASIFLVAISVYVRVRMKESPLFERLKSAGKTSTNPLRESFVHRSNLKMVLLALFGATMGQGVIWYTGQFYAQSFIENVCKIDFDQSRTILIWAIVFATPFFVVFGHLSDKIGRKWIMLTGMFLAIVSYRPLFAELRQLSDEKKKTEIAGSEEINTSTAPLKGTSRFLRTKVTKHHFDDGMLLSETKTDTVDAENSSVITGDTANTLHPSLAAQTRVHAKPDVKTSKLLPQRVYWKMIGLVFIMILYVTMVYGPIAAFLVELFPTRIRYTSMSLPYHVGNGIFGGLTPFIAVLLTTIYPGDKLVGLYYPVIVGGICLLIGLLYLRNR
ncbi:MAG TPA: MFS transporter, partial [Chitinophagaceae bacterium]